MAPSLALSTAEKLRKDGNTYFKKDRFAAAIDAYTEVLFCFCDSLLSCILRVGKIVKV